MTDALARSGEKQSDFVEVAAPAAAAKDAPAASPGATPPGTLKIAAAAPPASAPPRMRQVAVVVCHGMGQQLPFETLDNVVRGLTDADARRPALRAVPKPRLTVRLARVGGEDLPRAEIELASSAEPTRVHLYEAYWAPITEGRVRLVDVAGFLFRGGFNGLRNANRGAFRRWMFGRSVTFPESPSTGRMLTLILAVLAALALVNATAAAVAANLVAGTPANSFLGREVMCDVGVTIWALLAAAGVLVALLFWTRARFFLVATLVLVVLVGFAIPALPLAHRLWGFSPWAPLCAHAGIPVGVVFATSWAALFLASLFVRRVLVQFVGDVAAYVSPHELDRFADLRQRIKDTVRKVAEAVYADRDAPGRFAYDRVAVVGHSLGSVAAYDCVNALINHDRLAPAESFDVLGRTALLMTFGSPLDKTAFIFKRQGHRTGETREALAAAVQPLIQDYALRPFPWVNVWSAQDPVSGRLDFYDDKLDAHFAARRVVNLEDPQATTPLIAHQQYWRGPLVFDELVARIG